MGNQSSGTVGLLPRVFLPATVTLVSPGGYDFDVQEGGDGAGQLMQGTDDAFDGMNRLQVGGADYTPAAAAASLTDNGQSVLFGSQTLAALTVSREVTVPDGSGQDFARTIDSFQNTTANNITTTVTILGNLGSDVATTVFATSDGTGVVSPNDQWIGTDDAINGGGTPAVISCIHGPAGLVPTSVSLIGDNLVWTYSITVPAGQTVRLATFTIQSMSRATAIAEANALVTTGGLGGEAGLLLTPAVSASLVNFDYGMLAVSSTSVDSSGVLTPGEGSITVAFNEPVLGSGTVANYRLAIGRTGRPAGYGRRHHDPHHLGHRGQPGHAQVRQLIAGHLPPDGLRYDHGPLRQPARRQRSVGEQFHPRFRRRAPAGEHSFGTASTFSSGGGGQPAVAVGDFNGDGETGHRRGEYR